ncbi:MAG: ABC transporter ATP-binding protein/permease [Clostridia bacterium]|nr:ABC transporter ATP-binding protein/permease [Clostridia bacterium]
MKNINKTTLKRILKYMSLYKRFVISSFIFALISVAATLVAPIIIGKAIDLLIGQNQVDFTKLSMYLLILTGVIIIDALSQWLMNMANNRLVFNMVKSLRNDLIEKFQVLPLSKLDTMNTGDLVNNMVADAETFSDGILIGVTQLFTSILTILGTVVFMFVLNPIIAAAVVVVSPVSILLARFIAKRTKKNFKESAQLRSKQTSLADEMITNIKTIKAYSYENELIDKFEGINKEWRDSSIKAVFYSSLVNPSTRLINSIIYGIVVLLGSLIAADIITGVGVISIGTLSSLLSYTNKYTKPFNEISGIITDLTSSIVSAERIFKILDEEVESSDINNVSPNLEGNVRIENVYFSYVKDIPLIQNFNLKVNKGQKIAIVGPTGCGKTTLINLLMRFYDVNSGAIYVDENNINNITRHSLRDAYGMVLQESWIMTATVRENLTFGVKKDDEEIKQVLSSCKLEALVNRLPNGLDSILTENDLSQGEKQLLCIARVMLSDPKMLILDEATSSVDTKTEIDINKAFDILMKDKTSFIVAHRLSTIKNADLILVMNKGNIIEQGTHTELLSKNGFYTQLYNSRINNS